MNNYSGVMLAEENGLVINIYSIIYAWHKVAISIVATKNPLRATWKLSMVQGIRGKYKIVVVVYLFNVKIVSPISQTFDIKLFNQLRWNKNNQLYLEKFLLV